MGRSLLAFFGFVILMTVIGVMFGLCVAAILSSCSSTALGQVLDTGGWRASGSAGCRPGDPNCQQGQAPAGYAYVRDDQSGEQPVRHDPKYAAIVHVRAEEPGGMASSASGTIVDQDAESAYVLTVSHLFDDWQGGKIAVEVLGKPYYATLLGRDPNIDVAVLKIRNPGIQTVAMGEVGEGESYAGGYPMARSLRWVRGRFVAWREQTQRRGGTIYTRCVVFTGSLQSGASGGPVIQDGRLVAVTWGGDGRETYGTPVSIVRRVFGHLLPCWRGRGQSQTVIVNPPPVLPRPGPGPEPDPGPPEPPTGPIEPEGSPTPHPDLMAVNERLDALAKAIAAIPAGPQGLQGLQGLQGPPGDKGEQGPRGNDGAGATIDLDALAAKVAGRLPPITFQAVDTDGKPTGPAVSKRLGETLTLRSYLIEKSAVRGETKTETVVPFVEAD